jgi:hypothetical protein
MHFHAVSAHFGGPRPWTHYLSSSESLSSHYYDDRNTPSRHNAMHPRLKAKIPKMLEWMNTEADWYIWMDSSIRLNDGIDLPKAVMQRSQGKPLCLFRHSAHSSIQQEAQVVQQAMLQGLTYHLNRYSGEPLASQVENYLSDQSFKDNKLFEMTFFAYHRSAAPLMQEWFMHNCLWSIEDQISFPYVLHKSGLEYSCFEGSVCKNEYFTWDWQAREKSLLRHQAT